MNERHNSELSFISLTGLMLNRKWLFIITFLVVIIASLAFLFLRPEQYTVSSKIKISESYIYSNNQLYEYFPQDTEELWIFATHRLGELEDEKLEEVVNELDSDEIIGAVAENLGIDAGAVKEDSEISLIENNIIITTTSDNPEEAIRINKEILNTYIGYKTNEFREIYEAFLSKITSRTDDDYRQMEELTEEKGMNDAEYRIEYSKPLEERDTGIIASRLANLEILNRKISNLNTEYDFLLGVRNNLAANEDFFINRIEVLQEPHSDNIILNISLRMNIIYSIITAIIIAFILTFSVALFSYSKYTGRHLK